MNTLDIFLSFFFFACRYLISCATSYSFITFMAVEWSSLEGATVRYRHWAGYN